MEDRRRAARQRALEQPRCGACGCFAKDFYFGAICFRCKHDTRVAIQRKVEQARRWQESTHPEPPRGQLRLVR